jgi:hypothetical protein
MSPRHICLAWLADYARKSNAPDPVSFTNRNYRMAKACGEVTAPLRLEPVPSAPVGEVISVLVSREFDVRRVSS